MSWGQIGGIAGPVLTFLAIVLGLLFARSKEKKDRAAKAAAEEKERVAKEEQAAADRAAAAAQAKADREAAAAQAKAEIEARRAQELYDQMQEDRASARAEIRSLQTDVSQARAELTKQAEEAQRIWSQFAAVRRELDDAEAHIADVHRWDDTGRQGPMPQRKGSTR